MTTQDEYLKALELADKASDRGYSKAKNPFLVEPFCAQVAWMGKHCPVYPPTAGHPREVCKFLISDDHQDYRCPVLQNPLEIFKPIFERGTKEQKQSLEQLADMAVKYSQNPLDDDNQIWLEVTNYSTLSNAIQIYQKLGLKQKAEQAKQIRKKIWKKHSDEIIVPSKEEREEEKRHQRKLDEKSKRQQYLFLELLKLNELV